MGRWTKVWEDIRDPRLALYRFARRFIRSYEGFSYRFERNGEKTLIDRLGGMDIDVVFDVGANIGDWTEMALERFPKAKVHAFELSEATFANLSARGFGDRVRLNNVGLSNAEGKIDYKDYGENAGGNTILGGADYHDLRTAPALKTGVLSTGGQYCKENKIERIDFLKIDVEGAEHMVLEGFSDLLTSQSIRLVQFEYGYTNADAHFLIKDFYAFFAKFGYVVGVVKPKGVIFQPFSYRLNDFDSGPNFVAVRKSDEDMIAAIRGPSIKGYT